MCELQLASYGLEIVSKVQLDLVLLFFGFSHNNCMYSGHGMYMYSQATPGLLNTCITGYDEFACNELCKSRSSIVVFFY